MRRRAFRRGFARVDDAETRSREWNELIGTGRKFHLVHGRETYIVHTHDPIGRHIYFHGEYDFDKVERSIRLLGWHSLRTLVDVGANIGTVCIPAVGRGVAEQAIAIEPDPVNVALLRANVAMNGLDGRIRCIENAVGPDDHREVLLELSEENKGDHRIASASGVTRDRRAVSVQMRRLDSLVPSLDPSRDLIFMDVQGYEKNVLDGADLHMSAHVPIVMELWPEGMMDHCGFEDLFAVVSRYSHFYDLDPAAAPVPIPIEKLGEVWDEFHRSDAGFGDILLV